MVGGTEGADARARERLWSLARCGFLIGIAGAVALNGAASSFDNSGDRPAGLPTEEGNIKSSRFMASWGGCGTCACWSCDFLSCCAMPLGADRGGGLAPAAGGGIISLSLLCMPSCPNLHQRRVLAVARGRYAGSEAGANGGIRTLYCDPARLDASSWPSSARSGSPCALHSAAASLLVNTASISAYPAGRSSASPLATRRLAWCPHHCQMLGISRPGACPGGHCRRRWRPPWRSLAQQTPCNISRSVPSLWAVVSVP
jgi:hypothetical protein